MLSWRVAAQKEDDEVLYQEGDPLGKLMSIATLSPMLVARVTQRSVFNFCYTFRDRLSITVLLRKSKTHRVKYLYEGKIPVRVCDKGHSYSLLHLHCFRIRDPALGSYSLLILSSCSKNTSATSFQQPVSLSPQALESRIPGLV